MVDYIYDDATEQNEFGYASVKKMDYGDALIQKEKSQYHQHTH